MFSFLNFILRLIGASWRIGKANAKDKEIFSLEKENKRLKVEKEVKEKAEKRKDKMRNRISDLKDKASKYIPVIVCFILLTSCTSKQVVCPIEDGDIPELPSCESSSEFTEDYTCLVSCEYNIEFYTLDTETQIQVINACRDLRELAYQEVLTKCQDTLEALQDE